MTKDEFLYQIEQYRGVLLAEAYETLVQHADKFSDEERAEIVKRAKETQESLITTYKKVDQINEKGKEMESKIHQIEAAAIKDIEADMSQEEAKAAESLVSGI